MMRKNSLNFSSSSKESLSGSKRHGINETETTSTNKKVKASLQDYNDIFDTALSPFHYSSNDNEPSNDDHPTPDSIRLPLYSHDELDAINNSTNQNSSTNMASSNTMIPSLSTPSSSASSASSSSSSHSNSNNFTYAPNSQGTSSSSSFVPHHAGNQQFLSSRNYTPSQSGIYSPLVSYVQALQYQFNYYYMDSISKANQILFLQNSLNTMTTAYQNSISAQPPKPLKAKSSASHYVFKDGKKATLTGEALINATNTGTVMLRSEYVKNKKCRAKANSEISLDKIKTEEVESTQSSAASHHSKKTSSSHKKKEKILKGEVITTPYITPATVNTHFSPLVQNSLFNSTSANSSMQVKYSSNDAMQTQQFPRR